MKPLIAIALAALSACSAMPSSRYESMYYLDGVDRRDGMSATLSQKDGHLRIAGEAFAMDSCSNSSLVVCFTSEYLAFAYPSENGVSWQAAGYTFTKAGTIASPETSDQIDVIRSVQRYGTFHFYFSRRLGLLGWDLSYEGVDGAPEIDRYRRHNLRQIHRSQSNNSLMPMPLRGSA